MALERIIKLRPVKRHHSERYLLMSLVTFALAVVVLRGILELSVYPQTATDRRHKRRHV